jgi:hypothetical protein
VCAGPPIQPPKEYSLIHSYVSNLKTKILLLVTVFNHLSSVALNMDPLKSTEEWYSDSFSASFVGPYAKYRRALDYSHHKPYNLSRQKLHDDIIDHHISDVCKLPNQWLVFTAGAMGAGLTLKLLPLSLYHA